MAGGIGSRFWPLSKKKSPKQFIDILGTGKSLLRQTFERFNRICPVENIYIVTNVEYKDQILDNIPEISEKQILLEPRRRNTAPCIEYANFRILKENPDAIVTVAPSDHLILDENGFIDVINESIEFVEGRNALLTLGIKPSRPETGYGYIQANPEVKILTDNKFEMEKVKTFAEKPNYEMAKVFFESGEFYWNSGIFIWSLSSIMNAFKVHLPEVHNLFQERESSFGTKDEDMAIDKIYSECKNISIDYGIMEHAENVYVLKSDFGWSDLGTWTSLYENSNHSDNGNLVNAKQSLLDNVKNTIVVVPDNKLVVLQGLDDYIVVDANNVLLVCRRNDEEQIRKYVNDAKVKYGGDFV